MNALARREHSRLELEQKLAQRFPDCRELVAQVLNSLAEEGLQSDARFAESYCRAKMNRGYGRLHIENALKAKGVDPGCFRQAIHDLNPDWFELAVDALKKRFGHQPPQDFHEKARRMRFLQYRGFSSDQIRLSLDSLGKDYPGS